MKKSLLFLILLLTIAQARSQNIELTERLLLNGNDDVNPMRISTTIGENWNSIDNVNGQIGYWGIFSNHQDMDFGTESGNATGRVHLVIGTAPKLTVASDGDVGIGTQIPDSKLHVNGDIRLPNTNRIIFGEDQGFGEHIRNSMSSPSNPAFGLAFFANSTEVMRISAQFQNVGIGTDNPSEKLDVNGKVKIRDVQPGSGDYVMIDTNGVLVRSSPAPINDVEVLEARIVKLEQMVQSLIDDNGN